MPREPHVYQEEAPKLQLERLARRRIKRQKELTQSMEIPPKDLYDIYDRLNRQYARAASPVGLDTFWQAVVDAAARFYGSHHQLTFTCTDCNMAANNKIDRGALSRNFQYCLGKEF